MEESEITDLLLQKLEEYGDSVVEGKSKKKKSKAPKEAGRTDKKFRGAKSTAEHLVIQHSSPLSERQRKKLKKKRKKEQNNFEIEADSSEDSEKTLSGHERRLQEMSKQLGLAEFKLEMERKKKEQEEKEQKRKEKEPEVIVFKSHKPKKQKKTETVGAENTSDAGAPEFDMRQARFDVQKFGIKGFQGNKKEEAMTALLIKLGAKLPKKQYLNYKEYQEQRRQEMMDEKQKREMDRKLGLKVPKANRGKKRSRDRNDIGVIDGQVGRWKSGVQIINKDDLQGMKKARKK